MVSHFCTKPVSHPRKELLVVPRSSIFLVCHQCTTSSFSYIILDLNTKSPALPDAYENEYTRKRSL